MQSLEFFGFSVARVSAIFYRTRQAQCVLALGSAVLMAAACSVEGEFAGLRPADGDAGRFEASPGAADAGDATADSSVSSPSDASNDTPAQPNAPPWAADSELTAIGGIEAKGSFTSGDLQGDALVHRVVRAPRKGDVVLAGDATHGFTYRPRVEEWGTDDFEYQVSDGTSDAPESATVRIKILPAGPVRLTPDSALRQEKAKFGSEVDIDGDIAVIGAFPDTAFGGAAFVARRASDGTWTVVQKLTAGADDESASRFGDTVAIEGDWILVSAWGDWEGGSYNPGTVFCFKKNDAGEFVRVQRLKSPTSSQRDSFGFSLAMQGNRAIIGAPDDDVVGAAFIYALRADGQWEFDTKLTAHDSPAPPAPDRFGEDVAIDGDTVIVAAPWAELPHMSGALYTFHFDKGWKFESKLTAVRGAEPTSFGARVALDGNTAVSNAVAGQQWHLYVLTRTGPATWHRQILLSPVNDTGAYGFGWRTAIEGDTLVAMDRGVGDVGRGFVYARTGGGWTLTRTLELGNSAAEQLGWHVAIEGTSILASAPNYPGGAVYFFNVPR